MILLQHKSNDLNQTNLVGIDAVVFYDRDFLL